MKPADKRRILAARKRRQERREWEMEERRRGFMAELDEFMRQTFEDCEEGPEKPVRLS